MDDNLIIRWLTKIKTQVEMADNFLKIRDFDSCDVQCKSIINEIINSKEWNHLTIQEVFEQLYDYEIQHSHVGGRYYDQLGEVIVFIDARGLFYNYK